MVKPVDCLYCPITSSDIDIGLCQDIQSVADDAMKESILEFQLSAQKKEICKSCKKRIDPSL